MSVIVSLFCGNQCMCVHRVYIDISRRCLWRDKQMNRRSKWVSMCVLCVRNIVIKDSHLHHTGVYSYAKLLLVIWPGPLRAPGKEMIHVSIWIENHMLSSQYFAIEIADKDFPVRQESLTFNKSQLFQCAFCLSVCLSALMSVHLEAQENIFQVQTRLAVDSS